MACLTLLDCLGYPKGRRPCLHFLLFIKQTHPRPGAALSGADEQSSLVDSTLSAAIPIKRAMSLRPRTRSLTVDTDSRGQLWSSTQNSFLK